MWAQAQAQSLAYVCSTWTWHWYIRNQPESFLLFNFNMHAMVNYAQALQRECKQLGNISIACIAVQVENRLDLGQIYRSKTVSRLKWHLQFLLLCMHAKRTSFHRCFYSFYWHHWIRLNHFMRIENYQTNDIYVVWEMAHHLFFFFTSWEIRRACLNPINWNVFFFLPFKYRDMFLDALQLLLSTIL